jgi:dTDP-4-amino-4,6-dideoxygalactose transaminase
MSLDPDTITFSKASIVGRELEYVAAAAAQGHLSGDGEFTRRCSEWLVDALGCRHALLTHSCTAALELAAIVSGVGPGDEVLMPSFTFASTANAFVLRGATPVFVDIDSETLDLDAALAEAALTPRTRAIVPVHYAGVACDMDRILALASRHRLTVIEDAAQALLATWQGRPLGAIGDLGCLSFHDTKNVICGEGGALLFRDKQFIERAEIAREKGTNRTAFFKGLVDKYTWVDIGSSYLPGELTAAFLLGQLQCARRITEARLALCLRYAELLAELEGRGLARLPRRAQGATDSGHIFYLLTGSPAERESLRQFLLARKIHAVSHYVPLHSSAAGLRFGRTASPMPVTDRVSATLLRLPLFHDMGEAHQDRVAKSVREFYGLPPA